MRMILTVHAINAICVLGIILIRKAFFYKVSKKTGYGSGVLFL